MSSYRKNFAATDPDDYENCPDFLARFLQYLRDFESRKPSYIQDTLLCLREFLQFVQYQADNDGNIPADRFILKPVDISQLPISAAAAVTSTQVETYLHFAETVLKNACGTTNKKTKYLRRFFGYLLKNSSELGICLNNGNPVSDICSSLVPSAPASILTEAQVQQILSCIPTGESGSRDKAIILLLATSTLSISELVNLDRSDIVFTNNNAATVVIFRSGQKCEIPLRPACASMLKSYMKETQMFGVNALFLSTRSPSRMTERGIQQRIRIAAGRSGVCQPVTAQVLRDTAIANILANAKQGDEELLKEALVFKSNSAFKRAAAREALARAAACSPTNGLEVK